MGLKSTIAALIGVCALVTLLAPNDRFNRGLRAENELGVKLDRDASAEIESESDKVAEERDLTTTSGPLRVAVFGSSQAYGAGLENRFDAFPYLLSNDVDNYAAFSAGPNYPSVCLETMLPDDKVYDVILLQYYLRAKDGLIELAERLHKRYPQAVIIVMKFWGPYDARRKESEDSEDTMTFHEWKATVEDELQNGQLNDLVKVLEKDTGYWYFPEHPRAEFAVSTAIKHVDGYRFHLPHAATPKDTLVGYLRFFDAETNSHLSTRGHSYIKNMTSAIVHDHIMKQSELDYVNSATLGDWDGGDKCNLFYTTGALEYEHSENLVMNEFDEIHGKYALEITEEGWMDVENPFSDDRTLYMSYVGTLTGSEYPVMSVAHSSRTYTLIPKGPEIKNAGIVKTTAVGTIPAGETVRLKLTPWTTEDNPFRLVGVSFSNEKVTPGEFSFGPMFNR